VTQWEYARLEYEATGSLGTDKFMDWDASFHFPGGVQRWGTDERFDDLRHLNRAGASGWQAYNRSAVMVGQAAAATLRVPKTTSVEVSGLFVLVEDAAQAVTLADGEACDRGWIG
jgi:hypothetical protein